MKKETREFTVVQREVVYVAGDGTTFKDENECKKYEETANYVLKTRLINKSLIYLPTGYKEKTTGALSFGLCELFNCCDDYDFYLFCPKKEEDIKTFIQWTGTFLHKACLEDKEKRTKENNVTLASKLLIDDSDLWDKFNTSVNFSEIKVNRVYLFSFYEDWGRVFDVEKIKETQAFILDTIVKQFKK